MAKSMVRAEHKKRRISKYDREELTEKENQFNEKLKFIDIKPPKYLNNEEKKIFRKYTKKMKDLNILSILDDDILGHYVIFSRIFNELKEQLGKD
ncbi:MAG: hypothetical protein RSE41_01825, partial [Clostridia bacterium]